MTERQKAGQNSTQGNKASEKNFVLSPTRPRKKIDLSPTRPLAIGKKIRGHARHHHPGTPQTAGKVHPAHIHSIPRGRLVNFKKHPPSSKRYYQKHPLAFFGSMLLQCKHLFWSALFPPWLYLFIPNIRFHIQLLQSQRLLLLFVKICRSLQTPRRSCAG